MSDWIDGSKLGPLHDPGDGSVLVQVERPPNLYRMTPKEADEYLSRERAAFLIRVAMFLESADEITIRALNGVLTKMRIERRP